MSKYNRTKIDQGLTWTDILNWIQIGTHGSSQGRIDGDDEYEGHTVLFDQQSGWAATL